MRYTLLCLRVVHITFCAAASRQRMRCNCLTNGGKKMRNECHGSAEITFGYILACLPSSRTKTLVD